MKLYISFLLSFILGILIFLLIKDRKFKFFGCGCGCNKCGKDLKNVPLVISENKINPLETIKPESKEIFTQEIPVRKINEDFSRMLGFNCY
jgi:hypothetical protein